MKLKLFFYFCVILWTRIPKYHVDIFVSNFLAQNDCFYQYFEDTLYLKCLKDGELVNVKIEVYPDSITI